MERNSGAAKDPGADAAGLQPAYRAIALYLPQFHPIPENDQWWEPGFTEWSNVAKARPLFPGHHQPNLPADLGFYDLRVPEVREAQAALARNAGIEGFCYWHYWFGGRRILERPFTEVLASGRPDFPFCLAWANESWQGVWHGCERRMLIEQTYPGKEDVDAHFYSLLDAFQDRRYIRVREMPLFMILQPTQLPESRRFTDRWQELARANGLPGIHFVAHNKVEGDFDWHAAGFSAAVASNPLKVYKLRIWKLIERYFATHGIVTAGLAAVRIIGSRLIQKAVGWQGGIYRYEDAIASISSDCAIEAGWYAVALPNWDNSPRAGRKGVILHKSTPELYRRHLREVLAGFSDRPREERILFIKSWNEWAEGNYLEPDQRFGRQYLSVTGEELFDGSRVAR